MENKEITPTHECLVEDILDFSRWREFEILPVGPLSMGITTRRREFEFNLCRSTKKIIFGVGEKIFPCVMCNACYWTSPPGGRNARWGYMSCRVSIAA